ncbi:MAG: hypothetical protein J6581_10040 [Apibacter sp.]|nr:hypothetical protein [Apibacter sp.]
MLRNKPDFAKMLPLKFVAHIQLDSRVRFKGTAPPRYTWHYNAHDPKK